MIDEGLVRRLIAGQFPQWADLPVRAVPDQGWDNRTFRLGESLSVRLPSAAAYAAQVEKEAAWLPRLAPQLPLPIPEPVAMGEPSGDYPWRWSINRWIEGETVGCAAHLDLTALASALGAFLTALRSADASDGPAAGPHSFWRGGPLATYDGEARRAIAALGERIDERGATGAWKSALAGRWEGPPVWFHGDVAAGNLLTREGRLSGVIDFGCCGVGDPACDLAIAWTLFDGESRTAFREAVGLDAPTWARGRGWALWKALIVLAAAPGADRRDAADCPRIIAAIVDDHLSDQTRG